MNATELVKGVDFDLVAGNIQCIADRDGAQVFEVVRGRKVWRVLAYSQDEAEVEIGTEKYEQQEWI